MRTASGRRLALALGLAASLLLSGCSSPGYYWQSLSGHARLMLAARPVDAWLADQGTPEALKARLRLSQRMRDFAISTLKLPDNPSYRRYADLHRRSVVWNVVAAPPYALTLKTWCFPVTGCVGYRGYFDEAAARAEAAQIERDERLEVSVYGVPAYSTLGWMNWAGGDPLLNTFIQYPEGDLAAMIFHELAHQRVYLPDDTAFNESYATAVQRLGARLWLESNGSAEARAQYQALEQQRQQFRALTLTTRQALNQLYAQAGSKGKVANDGESIEVSALKIKAYEQFRSDYAALKARSGLPAANWRGYDDWVAHANNAAFGAMAAYDEGVPAFERLFVQNGSDWSRFFNAVEALAKLSKPQRDAALQQE